MITLTCSALDGSDYIGNNSVVTFPAHSIDGTERCILVSIIDDTTLEGDEIFTVTLKESDNGVVLGNNARVITISDSDGKHYGSLPRILIMEATLLLFFSPYSQVQMP